MKAPAASTTSKLILVVLSLILVCLALLVVKAYRPQDSLADSRGPAVSPSAEATDPEPAEDNRNSAARWTTNTWRRPPPANHLPFEPARVAAPGSLDESASPTVALVPSTVPHLDPALEKTTVAGVVQVGVPASMAPAGTISGRVTLRGYVPPEQTINLGPTCGPLSPRPVTTRHYVLGPGGGLANVLVFVHRSTSKDDSLAGDDQLLSQSMPSSVPLRTDTVMIDQVGCMFYPYVTAMQISQTLAVRNSDPFLHNVHLTPRRNQEFNLGQPVPGQVNQKKLSAPESFARLKCDVHPWMFAYVSVVPHSFFAVTDTNGVFAIPSGLPTGRYQVSARHLKAGRQTKAITLNVDTGAEVNFEFNSPDVAPQNSVVTR